MAIGAVRRGGNRSGLGIHASSNRIVTNLRSTPASKKGRASDPPVSVSPSRLPSAPEPEHRWIVDCPNKVLQ